MAGAVAQPAARAASAAVANASLQQQPGPAWTTLTAAQKAALAPLAADWASIDAPRKAKWLEVAARFPAMPPEERERVQQRMAEWARLTPAERGRARLSFQESKQIPRQEKQARWEAYQALPEDERQALAQRAKRAADKPVVSASAAASSAAGVATGKHSSMAGAGATAPLSRPVAPTLVQAKPGATTTPVTRPVAPPPHQLPGQPRIAAKPHDVDRATLLPRSGPQAAASAAAQP